MSPEMFKYTPALATSRALGESYDNERKMKILQAQGLQDLMKAQQEYSFNEQNNPLKLEHQRALNQGLVLGNEGTSMTNDFTRQTQPSKIEATNAQSRGTIQKEHYEQAARMADIFTKGAYEVQTMPGMQRAARLAEIARHNGMDPSDPNVSKFINLATENPNKLIEIQNRIKQDAARFNPSYMGTVDAARIRGQYDLQQEDKRQAGANQRNTESINAGKYNRNRRDTMTELFRNADPKKMYPALVQQATLAYQKYQKSRDPDDLEAYEDLRFQADQMEPSFRAAMNADPRPGTPDLPGTTQGGVKANQPLNVQPPGLPATRMPTAATSNNLTQSLQGKSVSDIKSAYPIYGNMPDAQLRELVKKKFGVDLK